MSALVNNPALAKERDVAAEYAAYAHFVDMAVDTFGELVAREWMDTPNREFDNQAPLKYAKAHEFDPTIFDRYFLQIQHGVYR